MTTLIEPATNQPLNDVPRQTRDDVDRIVRNAATAFAKWRAVDSRSRGRILQRLANLIRENADELARTESRNVGKPIRDSRDEVGLAADCFEFYAGATNKISGQTIPAAAPGVLLSFREPVGVCGIITPWNFPIAIASWKSAPALAMGNAVVLKPAEQTPLTALRLASSRSKRGCRKACFHRRDRTRLGRRRRADPASARAQARVHGLDGSRRERHAPRRATTSSA
jgi:betaine-aldehyde dehydrogenase